MVSAAVSFGDGLVTGAPEDLAELAGTATDDLFVFGITRDVVREGAHLAHGEPADEFILVLACAGLRVRRSRRRPAEQGVGWRNSPPSVTRVGAPAGRT